MSLIERSTSSVEPTLLEPQTKITPDFPDLESRTHETALDKFKHTIVGTASTLAKWAVTITHAVADWFSKVIQWFISLFKCHQNSVVETESVSSEELDSVTEGDIEQVLFDLAPETETVLDGEPVKGGDGRLAVVGNDQATDRLGFKPVELPLVHPQKDKTQGGRGSLIRQPTPVLSGTQLVPFRNSTAVPKDSALPTLTASGFDPLLSAGQLDLFGRGPFEPIDTACPPEIGSLSNITATDAQLVPLQRRPLARNTVGAQTLSSQLRRSPQIRFAFGDSIYELRNPMFPQTRMSPAAVQAFRQHVMEMLEQAAQHPHIDIQVGEELYIRIFNPGYGRAIEGRELYRHTVHQLQSIMNADKKQLTSSENALVEFRDPASGKQLVTANDHTGGCPCRYCLQNRTVVEASHFQLTIGDENYRLENPFSKRKPTDAEVHHYQLELGRLLLQASDKKQFSVGIGDGPQITIMIDGDRPITSATFGQSLLAIADAQRTDAVAIDAIHQPRSLPEPIQAIEAKTVSGLPSIARNHLPSIGRKSIRGGEIAIVQNEGNLSTTLENLAASRYPEDFVVLEIQPAQFPLFASTMDGLEHGRNLLLNYIDEHTTVWNAHPVTLGYAVQYCIELSRSGVSISEAQKSQIRFFFKKLKAASQFDLRFYLSGQDQLQRLLSPRLDEMLKIEKPTREQQLETDLVRAELATSFGVGIVPTQGGKNGAVFIQTFEGRSVGVFKAPPELSVFDFIERMKMYFGQARLLSHQHMAQEYAEVVAADMSRCFGFDNIAPEAIMAKFGGAEGAYISFLAGYCELSKIKHLFEARESYSVHEQIEWQKKEVWNKLIENLDPHDDNVFVVADKQTGVIEKISMIDHGNSFPEYNPAWLGSRGNMEASSFYSISKLPFRPEVRAFIRDNITEAKFQLFIDSNERRGKFFSDNMKKLQIQRIKLLQLVADGTIQNPVELMAIQTEQDYQKYLRT